MEQWKDITDYEGHYQVSDLGRIKSLDRAVIHRGKSRKIKGRILTPTISPAGYFRLMLQKEGKVRLKLVSRIVAEIWTPNPDNLPFVCHKNDIPTDNRAINLFWGDAQSNIDDKVSKDRQAKGEGHPKSKLTEEKVREIRKLHSEGSRKVDLARIYNVSDCLISDICSQKRWKHVK